MEYWLAGELGFEPRLTESESANSIRQAPPHRDITPKNHLISLIYAHDTSRQWKSHIRTPVIPR